MPLLLALKRCNNAEREMVVGLLKSAAHRSDVENDESQGPLEVGPVVELIERYHCARDTVRRARKHIETARAAIAAFSDGDAKDGLLAVAEHCVARDR